MHNMNKKPTKPLNQLKNVHYEHYAQLQNKHYSETVLLDDLKLFCKQHAAIDREYGLALQKLVNSFLSRKELINFKNSMQNERSSQQSIWRVWYSILTESNNIALSRLRASDNQQRLCNELKPLKSQRLMTNKRVFEQLKILQSDIAACVQDMVKSHKVYAEEEKQAQETRLKTMTAKEKIQRRSTDLFHSMAHLHRNYSKLLNKRQAFDARSGTARNEYLFQLTAINAHLKHYFANDLPYLVKTLDGELYEKLCDVFTSLCQTEMEICNVTEKRFENLLKDSSQINRVCAWELFLKSSPLFDKTIQYQFEPMKGDDEITLLCSTNMKENNLVQIARKLSRRLVLRERRIKSYENEMKVLQAGFVSNPTNPSQQSQITTEPGHQSGLNPDQNEELLAFNQEYVEHKVDELQFAIRREEIERVKIDACLNLLRSSSVDVNECINEARLAAEAASAAAAKKFREENANDLLHDINGPGHSALDGGRAGTVGSFSSMSRHIDYWDRTVTGSCNTGCVNGFSYEYSTQNHHQYSTGEYNSSHNTWSSTLSRQPHDYLNVDPHRQPQRASDDIALHKSVNSDLLTKSNYSALRVASSFNLTEINKNHATDDSDDSDDNAINGKHDEQRQQPELDTDLEAIWSEFGRLQRARVLYEFRAKRADELDLVVHETVVLLNSKQNSSWVKVRSLIDGKEGLVPYNYLTLINIANEKFNDKHHNDLLLSDLNASKSVHIKTTGNESPLLIDLNNIACLNTNETNNNDDNNDNPYHIKHCATSLSQSPVAKIETANKINQNFGCNNLDENLQNQSPLFGSFCRSLIDFHGTNKDELTFIAGSVIRILGRAPIISSEMDDNFQSNTHLINNNNNNNNSEISNHNVDDGWWEGELLLKIDTSPTSSSSPPTTTVTHLTSDTSNFIYKRGVFPSMLVQLVDIDESSYWTKFWKSVQPMKKKDSNRFRYFVGHPNDLKQTQDQLGTLLTCTSKNASPKSSKPNAQLMKTEADLKLTDQTIHSNAVAGDYIQLKSSTENSPHTINKHFHTQCCRIGLDNVIKQQVELIQTPVNLYPNVYKQYNSNMKSDNIKSDEELQIAEV